MWYSGREEEGADEKTGMVMSSKKREKSDKKDHAAQRGCHLSQGEMKERGERPGEEMTRAMTHRSLEGLGYLGMLSAAPTDMRIRLPQTIDAQGQKTVEAHAPFLFWNKPLKRTKKTNPKKTPNKGR
jgi:hypothetical protein